MAIVFLNTKFYELEQELSCLDALLESHSSATSTTLQQEQDGEYNLILAAEKISTFYNSVMVPMYEQNLSRYLLSTDAVRRFDDNGIAKTYKYTKERYARYDADSNPTLDKIREKYQTCLDQQARLAETADYVKKSFDVLVTALNQKVDTLNEKINLYSVLYGSAIPNLKLFSVNV